MCHVLHHTGIIISFETRKYNIWKILYCSILGEVLQGNWLRITKWWQNQYNKCHTIREKIERLALSCISCKIYKKKNQIHSYVHESNGSNKCNWIRYGAFFTKETNVRMDASISTTESNWYTFEHVYIKI